MIKKSLFVLTIIALSSLISLGIYKSKIQNTPQANQQEVIEQQVSATKDTVQELLVNVEFASSNQNWDKNIMTEIGTSPIFDEGFMSVPCDKKVILELSNSTQIDIKNFSVDYTIIAYKNDITFGVDRLDIVDYKPIEYKKIDHTLHFEKIESNKVVEKDIFYVATFPKVEIEVKSIKSDGKELLSSPLSFEYNCEAFDLMSDSQDLRELLGITNSN